MPHRDTNLAIQQAINSVLQMLHRDTSPAIQQAIYQSQMMGTIRSKFHTGTQA